MLRSLSLILMGLVATACGDDSNRRITDVPLVNGDAPLIDAPPASTPVTVTVKNDAGPQADVHAYFQNADSSVVASMVTDATGAASTVMAAGGYVSIVLLQPPTFLNPGDTTSYQIRTWAGVKPGDHLVYDGSFGSEGAIKNVTFTLPIDTQHIFGSTYFLDSNCGSGNSGGAAGSSQSTVVFTVAFSGCPNDTADIVISTRSVNGSVQSGFSVTGQVIADGVPVSYVGKTFGSTTRTLELDNNTTDSQIDAAEYVTTARGQVFSNDIVLPTTPPAVGELVLPTLPANAVETLQFHQNEGRTTRTFIESGTTGDYTRDWSAVRIPDFDQNVTPSLDLTAHALAWANAAPTTIAADFSVAEVDGDRTGPDGTIRWHWFIAGPATTSSLVLPELPTDVQDFSFKADDVFNFDGLGQANIPGGYNAVRAAVFNAEYPAVVGKISLVDYSFEVSLVGHVRKVRSSLLSKPRIPFALRSKR